MTELIARGTVWAAIQTVFQQCVFAACMSKLTLVVCFSVEPNLRWTASQLEMRDY